MEELLEIEFRQIEEKEGLAPLLEKVVEACFQKEQLTKAKIYLTIILTTPEEIQKINKQYREIDNPTDVLSFPMFEKDEIIKLQQGKEKLPIKEVLGDIIISLAQVEKQAIEYEHSFERELAYMVVHGFYHLMGYDHMEEEDKIQMRKKEEEILEQLNITRA